MSATPPTTAPADRPALIGAPIPRLEDARFLRGQARFTDDLAPPGAAHAVAVRAPLPHAEIASIEAGDALAAPGVLAVLTAADVAAELAGPMPSMTATPPYDVRNVDGTLLPDGSQPVVAGDRVRFAGEIVAFVVAETLDAARDAAERVAVEYRELPAVTAFEDALAPGAPALWDDAPGNLSLDWSKGDRRTVNQIFERAAHVVRCELANNRIAPCFMEPRAAVASYDPEHERFTLHTGTQGAHGLQALLAGILEVEPADVRVVVPDMGGGFGARNSLYPELVLALLAARRLGRPVRWAAERGESFLTDYQARDQVIAGELALDEAGRFLALRAEVRWRHGAYLVARNPWVMVSFLPPTVGGVYRVPHAHLTMRGAFTNTTPQAAFRGIGRMESNYLMERLVDAAARERGEDPIELRRRNLVGPEAMPWTAAGGAVYTSGDFGANLERALALADHAGFAGRRARSESAGLRRGLGVGLFVENDGGAPSEFAEVAVEREGRIRVMVGTQDFGMGHRTLFAQVAAHYLEVDLEDVDVVFGDTDAVRAGSGSHGSRSARIGGTAVVMGVEKVIEQARTLAADVLEAAASDIEYGAGRFVIAGTDRSVSLYELAAREGVQLAADAEFVTTGEAHSNGCQICEVEVDPETGAVRIVAHTLVMDVGRAMNPLIVHGQLHGGAAQGLGQAGLEAVCYEAGSGQTLSGSFMDYAIPKADDLPAFTVALNEIDEPDNPLGVKGAGEGATSGAPAALVNAVLDALAPLGVTELQMPLTPLRVWEALRAARREG